MNLVDARNRIEKLMSLFVIEIKSEASMGKTDLNKAAETILIPLLNEIYGLSLENINYSEDDNNYPAIDLADNEARFSIQVTATPDLKKIKHTLTNFIKYSLYSKYDRLVIYILKEKQDSYSKLAIQEIIQDKFRFDPQKDIWDYRDILKEIANFPIDKTLKIQEILEANFGDGKFGDIDKLRQEKDFILNEIRTDIAGLVLNRADVVADVIDKLSKTLLLGIVGNPGSGKSAILKMIAQHQETEGQIMVLSGDRITGTGWNSYASNLQITRPLDKLLLALSNGSQTTIFIDGIDRITESGPRTVVNDLFRKLVELLNEANALSCWTVVYSAREGNLQDIYQWLDWQSLGQPLTVQVPELNSDELKRVAQNIPRLKPLLDFENLSPVLKSPFMLRLLENERITPNSGELPSLSTEMEVSDIWWKKLVGESGSVVGRSRKNSLLKIGKQVVRSPGKLFSVEEDASPQSIISLLSDRIILQDSDRELYHFDHDLLEDWVMYRVLDQHPEDLPHYLQEIGEPFGLYRSVQLLGVASLEKHTTADYWIKLIKEIEKTPQLSARWRQALLTAPLISSCVKELLNKAKPFLIADNAKLLIELMIALRTVEVTPNFPLISLSNSLSQASNEETIDQLMPRLMLNPVPRWSVWIPFMDWLLDCINDFPQDIRLESSNLMKIWQIETPYKAIYRKEIAEIALQWHEMENY